MDYASVGCLENTMVGNDRSGTVDINVNLYKALELTLGRGYDLITYKDSLWGNHIPANAIVLIPEIRENLKPLKSFIMLLKTS